MEKAKSQWGAQLFFDEQEGKEADSKTKTSALRNRSNDVIYICSYFVYTLSHYYAWVQWCNIYVPILYTYLTVKWCNIYRLPFVHCSREIKVGENKWEKIKENKIEGNKQENCYIGTGYSSSAFLRKEWQLVKVAVAVSTENRYS